MRRALWVGAPTLLWLAVLLLPLASAAGTPPTALFAYSPAEPLSRDFVTFEDRSTDVDGNITSWSWSFGDGATSTQQNPRHRFGAGNFDVELVVVDDEGLEGRTSASIHVAEAPLGGLPTWLYWLMPSLVSSILLLLGSLVLVKGQPLVYNRVFFLLCTASAFKGYTEAAFLFILDNWPNAQAIRWLLVSNRLIAFVYAPIFLWFVLVFPRPIWAGLKNGWRGAWCLLLAVPFALNLMFPIISLPAMQNVFNIYVSLLALACLALLVYHAWETDSDEEKHRLRLLSTTFFLIVFSTILVALFQLVASSAGAQGHRSTEALYEALGDTFGLIIAPVMEIFGLVLVMYGILRYQLLGVDLLIKRITRATLFAITIGIVFVIVSNSVEQLFQVTVLAGVPLDFLVAGFSSALLMYPIQKTTERIANKVFPHAENKEPDFLATRRMEIYEAQLRFALLDGHLREKELKMLDALRESLGVSAGEIAMVAQKFPGFDATPLGVRSKPAVA